MEKNLVIIISEEGDNSTDKVLGYLSKKKSEIIRVNDSDEMTNFIFTLNSNGEFIIRDISVNSNSIKKVWLRRGNFNFGKATEKYIFLEHNTLKNYLHFYFEEEHDCIGSLKKEYDHNKLIDLKIADECDLKTPRTFVISNSRQLNGILKKYPNKRFITKSLYNPARFEENGVKYYGGYTSRVSIMKENEIFSPTLIQEEIDKQFEVRVFYLQGVSFPLAIFSQNDKQTAVDFRNYNYSKPNRMIPFKLPQEIEEKINLLMEKFKINTGSIDFIVSPKNEFVFLEVNRVGQFDWVSGLCNYYIEKDIAELLAN